MKRKILDIDKYVYFYNKIYDHNHNLKGVESVLREQNVNNDWVLPANIDTLPFFILVDRIKKDFNDVAVDNFKVIIKLTLEQFLSRKFKQQIAVITEQLCPFNLVVEISYNELIKKKNVRRVIRRMNQVKQYGVAFSINNLGADFSFAKKVHYLLPVIDILKLDIKHFNQKEKWLDLTIKFWRNLAIKYQLELIVSGIETKADEQLLDLLSIDLRQGFLYGKPEKIIS